MEGMAYKKGLALALAVDPELPKHVLGDGLRLRQILLNLLGNAIKFTASGSVTLKARAATSRSGLPVVEVLVIDTGVGIPLARQASVFEEFVQADASTSRQFGGSGLGLTISRRLAALMGGEIKLSSTEGHGTQVTLTIPMTAAGHALPAPPEPAAEPMRAGADQNDEDQAVTILLAEDLDINQELITGMLDRMGYQVEIANNGEEALRLVGRLQEKPDAYAMVLMDIQMPVLDGIGAARAIRALGGRASEIPIVALTANAYEADILECRRAGMDDHLSKPVSMAALGAMVSRWVGQESLSAIASMEVAADKPSLAGKFADRKAAYGTRLTELRLALLAETGEERGLLITEARKIAHNLAGTAAMFGESGLGDTAAAVEDGLRDDVEGSSAWVDQLIDALRRAA
jgi:CheY-like chemotaxis protein